MPSGAPAERACPEKETDQAQHDRAAFSVSLPFSLQGKKREQRGWEPLYGGFRGRARGRPDFHVRFSLRPCPYHGRGGWPGRPAFFKRAGGQTARGAAVAISEISIARADAMGFLARANAPGHSSAFSFVLGPFDPGKLREARRGRPCENIENHDGIDSARRRNRIIEKTRDGRLLVDGAE